MHLEYQALEHVCFPQEAVSVWRGLIGRFIHRVSPSLNELFFETPQSILRPRDHLSDWMKGNIGLTGSHVPHPFVLRSASHTIQDPLRAMVPGSTCRLELVLIENAVRFLPLLCAMFEDLGLSGVGRRTRQARGRDRRGRLVLSRGWLEINGMQQLIYDGEHWLLPPAADSSMYEWAQPMVEPPRHEFPLSQKELVLFLKAPLRLTHYRKPVSPEMLTPRILAFAMWRRLGSLSVCYAPKQPAEIDLELFRERLERMAEETELDASNLFWQPRYRYSGRQKATVQTSGVIGQITLRADAVRIHQWKLLLVRMAPLHIGKGTSFGQGWLSTIPMKTHVDTAEPLVSYV